MNEIIDELTNLFQKILENRKTLPVSENIKLGDLKKICETSPQDVSIFKLEKYSYSMVHCNKSAYEYLGVTEEEILKMGYKYILKIIHPDNFNAMYKLIKYFNNPDNSHKIFAYPFHIKSRNGWEWTYTSVQPATFNEDGSVEYMLGVGCSINNLLKSKKQINLFKKNIQFYEDNMEKYLSMTKREKEILKLITEEFTSKEIAEKLSISSLTVDTHRRNLIEKFDVKSSIGLAKYSLLFDLA